MSTAGERILPQSLPVFAKNLLKQLPIQTNASFKRLFDSRVTNSGRGGIEA